MLGWAQGPCQPGPLVSGLPELQEREYSRFLPQPAP